MTEIARTMIDAGNEQLTDPTWTLVKKDGYILWGMAIANKKLGNQSQDKYNRPVRGFFGFISDTRMTKFPYGTTYFRDLYQKYVLPIWDSYEQSEQITGDMPIMSGFDFIGKSSILNNEINVDNSVCRIFPSTYDSKSLIEAVFSSVEDCSIATNVHSKKQCVEFGKDKISFTNAVMSSDSKVNKTTDVKAVVSKRVDVIPDTYNENDIVIQDDSTCTICGSHVNANEDLCQECRNKQQNKKYIKYGLYGFMAMICLLLMFNGSSIWEKILPSKQSQEKVLIEEGSMEGYGGRIKSHSPFLNTTKHEVNVSDANPDDVFMIAYESSSLIKRVNSANNWIRILTPSLKFSKKGIIEFKCEPLIRGQREGAICLTNDEGVKTIIPIYQSVPTEDVAINDAAHAIRSGGNRSVDARNVIVIESDVEASENAHNTETTPTFEPSNN